SRRVDAAVHGEGTGGPARLLPGPEEIATVAGISRRNDGLPVGLEPAAARLPDPSLFEVADRPDRPVRILSGSRKTALPRAVPASVRARRPPRRLVPDPLGLRQDRPPPPADAAGRHRLVPRSLDRRREGGLRPPVGVLRRLRPRRRRGRLLG